MASTLQPCCCRRADDGCARMAARTASCALTGGCTRRPWFSAARIEDGRIKDGEVGVSQQQRPALTRPPLSATTLATALTAALTAALTSPHRHCPRHSPSPIAALHARTVKGEAGQQRAATKLDRLQLRVRAHGLDDGLVHGVRRVHEPSLDALCPRKRASTPRHISHRDDGGEGPRTGRGTHRPR